MYKDFRTPSFSFLDLELSKAIAIIKLDKSQPKRRLKGKILNDVLKDWTINRTKSTQLTKVKIGKKIKEARSQLRRY